MKAKTACVVASLYPAVLIRRREVEIPSRSGVTLYNNQWWGIELEGDFRQSASNLNAEQQAALGQLCGWLSSLVNGFDPTQQVKVRRQVKPGGTDCPGKLFDPSASPDFLTSLRNHLVAAGAQTATPTII